MKTNIKHLELKTVAHCREYFAELCKKGEMYHPEDDAHEVVFEDAEVTERERERLNELMNTVYDICEKEGIDPCEIALDEIEKQVIQN